VRIERVVPVGDRWRPPGDRSKNGTAPAPGTTFNGLTDVETAGDRFGDRLFCNK
jgi:hypothetical protein